MVDSSWKFLNESGNLYIVYIVYIVVIYYIARFANILY